jgi:hypothetical protein
MKKVLGFIFLDRSHSLNIDGLLYEVLDFKKIFGLKGGENANAKELLWKKRNGKIRR